MPIVIFGEVLVRFTVVPFTVRFPPRVVRPVPVVMALLVVVFKPNVPVPVMSITVELPVRLIAVEEREVVDPLMVVVAPNLPSVRPV